MKTKMSLIVSWNLRVSPIDGEALADCSIILVHWLTLGLWTIIWRQVSAADGDDDDDDHDDGRHNDRAHLMKPIQTQSVSEGVKLILILGVVWFKRK